MLTPQADVQIRQEVSPSSSLARAETRRNEERYAQIEGQAVGAGRAAKRQREGFELKEDGDERSTLNVESAAVRPGTDKRVKENQLAVRGREARSKGEAARTHAWSSQRTRGETKGVRDPAQGGRVESECVREGEGERGSGTWRRKDGVGEFERVSE